MTEDTASQLCVMLRERDVDGTPAQVSLQDSERVASEDDGERDDEGEAEQGARDDERDAAEENQNEKKITDEDDPPEVRGIDARNLQLARGEFQ